MRINWHPKARNEIEGFEEEVQEQIIKHVESLETAPLGEDTSLMSKQGLEIFRLKLKNEDLDHRVFFDLDGDEVVVLGVEHRDEAYTQESIRELKSRQ